MSLLSAAVLASSLLPGVAPLSIVQPAQDFRVEASPIVVQGTLCHPQRLVVPLVPGLEAALLRQGARLVAAWPQIGYGAVAVRAGALQATRRALTKELDVPIDLDRAAKSAYAPNDPLFGDMWHAQALRIPEAWDLSLGSTVVVAVMDTGVETGHPDLAANIWTNSGEVAGNGLDDDANGYVDDIHGYDFTYGDAIPNDVQGHGTACAGLVASVMDNGIGACGAAPRAKIMALKSATDSVGYFYDTANIPAYLYAADNGAQVLSGSFYSDRVSAGERAALQYAVDHGVLPVIAAGNDNTCYPYYPASYDICMSVGALDTNLNRAGFSNYGVRVDVASPGVSLRTTTTGGGYTAGFAGTSGACPQVAGIAALLLGANPGATIQQVREAMENTAVTTSGGSIGDFTNYGRVNALAAMNALKGAGSTPKAPVVRAISPSFYQGGLVLRGPSYHRIYGRGFDASRTVRVMSGAKSLPITRRNRDMIEVAARAMRVPVTVQVDGVTVATYTPVRQGGIPYTALEVSVPGASRSGGHRELMDPDGAVLAVGRRGDGNFIVQATFANVDPVGRYVLILDRTYVNPSGTETIQLYNWSTASYPYGSFTTFRTGSLTAAPARSILEIGTIRPYLDDEGTAYFQLLGQNVTAADAQLRLDRLQLVRVR